MIDCKQVLLTCNMSFAQANLSAGAAFGAHKIGRLRPTTARLVHRARIGQISTNLVGSKPLGLGLALDGARVC